MAGKISTTIVHRKGNKTGSHPSHRFSFGIEELSFVSPKVVSVTRPDGTVALSLANGMV